MTDTNPDRDELRDSLEQALRPEVDKLIEDTRRPYRRLITVLVVGYALFAVASVVEVILLTR